MPKPIYGDNGNGMHCHQSIWKDGKPLFAGDRYAGISQMALYYIGGLLKHARAIAAFAAPTTNSYKRLVPGLSAGQSCIFGRNRSAAVRIRCTRRARKQNDWNSPARSVVQPSLRSRHADGGT